MACRVIYGDTKCIISIDSDYQMLPESSTKIDMTIHHGTLHNNILKIRSGTLVTRQKKVWDLIVDTLALRTTINDDKKNDYYFPKVPLYLIFDELSDPVCRAMFAVALGSDVFYGGLNRFGPQKTFKIKQQVDKLDLKSEKQQYIIKLTLEHKLIQRWV